MLRFVVPGDAVSFGTMSTQFKRGATIVRGTRKTTKAADWEAEVRRVAAEAWAGRPLLEGPLFVNVACRFALPKSQYRKRTPRTLDFKTTKPDEDKIRRLVLDAMEGVVYVHDAQVCGGNTFKLTGGQGQAAQTVVDVRRPTAADLEAVARFAEGQSPDQTPAGGGEGERPSVTN